MRRTATAAPNPNPVPAPARRPAAALAAVLVAALAGAPGPWTGPAAAQTKTGTTVAQFLRIEPSARSAGMGNAGVALPDGIDAVYYNPGILGRLQRPALTFTHSAWFADIAYDYAAGAVPVAGIGTFFGSITSLNSGDIQVRTVEQPLGTGENYTVADVAIGLGFGRQVTSRFAAGLQVNYVHQRIWNSNLTTLTVSAGTVYRLTDGGLELGFSLSNLGTEAGFSGRDLAIQFDPYPDEYGGNSALPAEQLTGQFPVPIVLRIGLSAPYRLGEEADLLLVADALHPNDNTESLNLGAELNLQGILALRAGWQTLFQQDTEQGLTLGAGLRLRDGGLEGGYAWADHDYLGGTHRFTATLTF